jgi:Tfp pilus assembly protein PilF/O-antigen ligase
MRQKIIYIFTVLFILFILPIAWTNPSPQARLYTILLLSLAGVSWLVIRLREDRPLNIPKAALPFLVYIILLVLLLKVTPLPFYGTYCTINLLFLFLGFLILSDITRSDHKGTAWENVFIGVGLFVLLFDLFVLVYLKWQWSEISGSLFSQPPFSFRSRGSFLGHPNLLAGYLNLIIPLVLIRLLQQSRILRRFFWCIVLAPFMLIQFTTFSRSGWLGLVSAICGMLVLIYWPVTQEWLRNWIKEKPIHSTRKQILITIAIVLFLLFITPLAIRQGQSVAHGSFSDRVEIWKYSLSLVGTSPLWGHGPGSIPFLFALRSDAIGGDEVFHSHNIFLEAAATTGMAGLLILLWGVALAVQAWIPAWRQTHPGSEERDSLVAYAGIGIGVAVQGLLDFIFGNFLSAIGFLFILALVYRFAPTQQFFCFKKKAVLPFFGSLFLVCIVGGQVVLQSSSSFGQGLNAAQKGDWKPAAESICRAAQENLNNTFYIFQCSLAQAHLAEKNGEPQALQSALTFQRAGLDRDPYWYIHWANLASYQWQMGDRLQAVQDMQKAADLAPQRSFLWLNLGWMEEQLNRPRDAQAHYHIALCLNLWYQKTIFFVKTPLRQLALSGECPAGFDVLAKDQALRFFWQGLTALEANNLPAAERLFQLSIQAKDLNSLAYAYLGLVHMRSNQPDQAWQDIQTALLINDSSSVVLLAAAQVTQSQGKNAQAMAYLSRVFDLISLPDYSILYYGNAYQSSSLPTDLSPFFVTPLTPDTQESLLRLADYLLQHEEIKKSQEVRKWIEQNSKQDIGRNDG